MGRSRTNRRRRKSKKQLAAKAVKPANATGIVNPGSDSTSKEDKGEMSKALWRPWLAKSHLAIYGQCFEITKPASGTSVSCSTSCALHMKKGNCFINVALGQTVQVIRCKADEDGRAPFGIRRGCNKVYATSDAKVYRGCCLRVYTQNIMPS
jgi:hypothetical protein